MAELPLTNDSPDSPESMSKGPTCGLQRLSHLRPQGGSCTSAEKRHSRKICFLASTACAFQTKREEVQDTGNALSAKQLCINQAARPARTPCRYNFAGTGLIGRETDTTHQACTEGSSLSTRHLGGCEEHSGRVQGRIHPSALTGTDAAHMRQTLGRNAGFIRGCFSCVSCMAETGNRDSKSGKRKMSSSEAPAACGSCGSCLGFHQHQNNWKWKTWPWLNGVKGLSTRTLTLASAK